MIFTGFLPNATKQDFRKALSFLFLPWKWFSLRKGKNILKVEDWFKKYFFVKYAITFDSGRTALQKALESLGIKQDDEVLIQAYTCIVVSNAVIWAGGKPIYVDINDDFNMDQKDLEKKITDKSKVLIIQHTFGNPANLRGLLEIAQKNNLRVIEDCAHSLGIKYNGKLTGTLGDIGMFSFGSDKVVSCLRGGALITNNENLGGKIRQLQQELPLSKSLKVWQYLLIFLIFAIGKPLYKFGIGKIMMWGFKKFNITGRIIYEKEKQGKQVSFYPSQLPNALAEILLKQLENLDGMNDHRRKIAKIYFEGIKNKLVKLPPQDKNSNYLRFTLLVDKSKKLLNLAKKQDILLGDWYNTVIAPGDCNKDNARYIKGSCPNAENLAPKSINLPTNINIKAEQTEKIIKFINSYAG